MSGAQNVLGQAVELGLDPIVHVSSFTALFHPNLETLRADLPVVGGTDGYGTSKAQVEIYARGLQDAGAPVNITYPGMVLGPPVGDQFGEAGEGVRSLLSLHAFPGRSAAWLIVDARDLAALHVALLEPGRGPRRYMAGGRRVPVAELASMFGEIAETPMLAVPVPDTVMRAAGAVLDQATPFLPFDTPFTSAGMQYYTQMPASDDSPSEQELGITYRDPRETVADTVAALRSSEQLVLFRRLARWRFVQPPLQPKQPIDNDADRPRAPASSPQSLWSRLFRLRTKPSTAAPTNGTGASVAISALLVPTRGLLRSPSRRSALSLTKPAVAQPGTRRRHRAPRRHRRPTRGRRREYRSFA